MSVCAAPTCSHQSFDGSSYYVDVDEEYPHSFICKSHGKPGKGRHGTSHHAKAIYQI